MDMIYETPRVFTLGRVEDLTRQSGNKCQGSGDTEFNNQAIDTLEPRSPASCPPGG